MLVILLLGMIPGYSIANDEWVYRTVTGASGVPLNVVSAGNPKSPGVLLIHGVGQSHLSFSRQLNSSLTDSVYLVAFDLRGHGNSGKPWSDTDYVPGRVWAEDLQAVMEATGLVRPAVVAWSYGTLVLADYVRAFGAQSIGPINLVGSYGAMVPMVPPKDADLISRFMQLKEQQVSLNIAHNISAANQSAAWLTHKPMDPETRQITVNAALMLPAYARRAMSQRRFDNADLIKQIRVPVLITRGEHDPSTPDSGASDLAQRLQQATVSSYPNTGHSPFYEQAERFNMELLKFVQRGCQPSITCLSGDRQ